MVSVTAGVSTARPGPTADARPPHLQRDASRPFTIRYLNLLAGLIVLAIVCISGYALWVDYFNTRQEAERSSRNVLTAIARDLTHDLRLLDLALKGVAEGLQHPELQRLTPDLQHRLLFDRSVSAGMLSSLLALNETGDTIADSNSPMLQSRSNFGDRDYFQVHKDNPDLAFYLSRPYQSRRRAGEYSIAVSRRLSHADGSFAGAVVSGISLGTIQALFKDLNLGEQGALSLYRDDGILLLRQPYNTALIGQDQSQNPNIVRALQERSGTIDVVSRIDGIRRLITFERLTEFPLLLTVSVSVDEAFASWRRRALVLGLLSFALCSAVVTLAVLFRRQLHLKEKTEAELSRLATTDPLTGLSNRRAFDEAFEREWRQAIRSGAPLSLIYIDGDFFKSYNDRYGHGRGDDLLVRIADTIGANARRPRDIAARYGGEEFVVLLPETDNAGAVTIGERIRHGIAAQRVLHEGSPLQIATVSIGAATVSPARGEDGSQLIKAADAALYVAKEAGRNRVHATTSE